MTTGGRRSLKLLRGAGSTHEGTEQIDLHGMLDTLLHQYPVGGVTRCKSNHHGNLHHKPVQRIVWLWHVDEEEMNQCHPSKHTDFIRNQRPCVCLDGVFKPLAERLQIRKSHAKILKGNTKQIGEDKLDNVIGEKGRAGDHQPEAKDQWPTDSITQ